MAVGRNRTLHCAFTWLKPLYFWSHNPFALGIECVDASWRHGGHLPILSGHNSPAYSLHGSFEAVSNLSALGIGLLLLDALLISPAHWPLKALEGVPPKDIAVSRPIAFWPAAPLLAPHGIIMTALVFEQPLALFEDPSAQMPTATGQVSGHAHRFNRFRESPDEWRERLLTKMSEPSFSFKYGGRTGTPFHSHPKTCGPQFCVISLESPETQ